MSMRTPFRPLLTGLSLALLACGSSPSSAPAPQPATAHGDAAPAEVSAPSPGGTLVIGLRQGVSSLHPLFASSATDEDLLHNLLLPTVDFRFDCRLEVLPGVVSSWTLDEAGTTLDLTLRDDLTWPDGEPVDAEDLRFTYELLLDPQVHDRALDLQSTFVDGQPPELLSPHQVRFRFVHPGEPARQLVDASATLLPQHLLADLPRTAEALAAHPTHQQPPSYGPWTLGEHTPHQHLTLVPNPTFTGTAEERPLLDRVVFRFLAEESARLDALRRGELDMILEPSLRELDALDAAPHLTVVRRGFRGNDYISFNQADPRFADLRVRKALTLALDIDTMMAKVLRTKGGQMYGKRAVSNFSPAFCDDVPADLTPLPYAPDQARALLAQAGWTDTDGDGWVDKDGVPFRFTMVTNDNNPRRVATLQRVQAYLKAVGVDLRPEPVANLYHPDGPLLSRSYEAVLAGWNVGLTHDPTSRWGWNPDGTPAYFNIASVDDPELRRLIEQGLRATDPAAANAAWQDVQRRLYDQLYATPLWWVENTAVVNTRVLDADINMVTPFHHLHAWHIAPDQRRSP